MIDRRNRILVILSDIDFSPQLVAILKILQDRGADVRIILIGKKNLKIAEELVSRGWNFRTLKPRRKFGSVINFILVSLEMFRFKPSTAFASGQFGTAIGMLSSRLLGIRNRVFIRHHSNFHQKYKFAQFLMDENFPPVCSRFQRLVQDKEMVGRLSFRRDLVLDYEGLTSLLRSRACYQHVRWGLHSGEFFLCNACCLRTANLCILIILLLYLYVLALLCHQVG